MNHSLSWMFASLMKVPFYVYFGHFWAIFGTFLNLSVSRIPCLLNWITSELNQQIFWNWIIFWIECWAKQYWIKYWMNHFLAKFKHWIESGRVSNTPVKSAYLMQWEIAPFFSWLEQLANEMAKEIKATKYEQSLSPFTSSSW